MCVEMNYYFNRELSWLNFNSRVLEEATKKEYPLMERLRFLSISASNLDEFFMVRVSSLKERILSNSNSLDPSNVIDSEIYLTLKERIHLFVNNMYYIYENIISELRQKNITFVNRNNLSASHLDVIEEYFMNVLFPVLTPLAVDKKSKFPLSNNKSLNIIVRLKGEDNKPYFSIIQIPSILQRFMEFKISKDRYEFILLEDIITKYIDRMFETYSVEAYATYRVTLESDFDADVDDEVFSAVVKTLKKRKKGHPVRLELSKNCDKEIYDFLKDMLNVEKDEIYEIDGPIDLTYFSKFVNLSKFTELCFPKFIPAYPPKDLIGDENIFNMIKERDRLIHHPYESFQSVVDFIRAAADDKKVLAIKQTLYRVSKDSPIVDALIRAAENGKHVTVLVEIKARFDEENNIRLAKKMERAGCNIIYGVDGLKTHCKVTLVIRQEGKKIRRYTHIGTGNYNESNAKIYTDISLFTCKDEFGKDASSLFNTLTGYFKQPSYSKFVVSPHYMRNFIAEKIEREITNANLGLRSGIIIKVNSLVDTKMINMLYSASMNNVPVTLIVRGVCCLIPGIEGVSDNIKVISVVGRFLEHSRIYRFQNDNNPELFIGSADLMTRNLDRRIEVLVPIEDSYQKDRVSSIIDTMLSDNTNAHIMQRDTSYKNIERNGDNIINSQSIFIEEAIGM